MFIEHYILRKKTFKGSIPRFYEILYGTLFLNFCIIIINLDLTKSIKLLILLSIFPCRLHIEWFQKFCEMFHAGFKSFFFLLLLWQIWGIYCECLRKLSPILALIYFNIFSNFKIFQSWTPHF